MKVYPDKSGALCANSHPGSYTGQDAFNDMLPVILNSSGGGYRRNTGRQLLQRNRSKKRQ